MKRSLALILALILCLSLTACGADPAETVPTTQAQESAAALSRGGCERQHLHQQIPEAPV